MKKLWLVIFTSQAEWMEPTIVVVRADDSEVAFTKACAKLGYSEEEVEENVNDTENELGYSIVEVEDIIE